MAFAAFFWLAIMARSEFERSKQLRRRSSRGDWLFPYEEDCRYDDIMLCINDGANKECICLRLLVDYV